VLTHPPDERAQRFIVGLRGSVMLVTDRLARGLARFRHQVE
jgi:hypothetical protein